MQQIGRELLALIPKASDVADTQHVGATTLVDISGPTAALASGKGSKSRHCPECNRQHAASLTLLPAEANGRKLDEPWYRRLG